MKQCAMVCDWCGRHDHTSKVNCNGCGAPIFNTGVACGNTDFHAVDSGVTSWHISGSGGGGAGGSSNVWRTDDGVSWVKIE